MDPLSYGNSRPPKRDFTLEYLERDADLMGVVWSAGVIDEYRPYFCLNWQVSLINYLYGV